MSEHPRVLVVTSAGATRGAVTPVIAALEATDMRVRAIDIGRAGSRDEGTIEKMMRALTGEMAERRLLRELEANPPDVTVAFDPATTSALTVARDEASTPAPVVAVVGDLTPAKEWAATDADRYLAIDDEAAVALDDAGVEGDRILTVGPVAEVGYAEAARRDPADVRRQFKLAGTTVVVQVDGLGYEITNQIALQLSLIGGDHTYVFDAGNDSDAAMALRRQVPALDMRAKLFGATPEAPLFWRAADVVVARPTDITVARAMMLGVKMVSFLPEDKRGEHLARAMESRGLGGTASNALLLSASIDPLLRKPRPTGDRGDRIGADGAGNIADVVWIVGSERRQVIEERRSTARAETRARVEAAVSAAEAAAQMSSAAGGLEDLSGAAAPQDVPDVPDIGEIAQLRAQVQARMGEVGKTVTEAQRAADSWHQRHEVAAKRGDDDEARQAERNADGERARMHAALAEMAQLQGELSRLDRAAEVAATAPRPPPGARASSASSSAASASASSSAGAGRPSVDDLLEQMKRQGGGTSRRSPRKGENPKSPPTPQTRTIDDELAALKRKMKRKKE